MAIALGWCLAASVAAAQPACPELLAQAGARYVERAFPEATAAARACLARGDAALPDAVAARRLLALIALRRNDDAQAVSLVTELLRLDPTYEADPVRDPPDYAGLVVTLRRALPPAEAQRAGPDGAPPAPPPLPPLEEVPQRGAYVEVFIGPGSYGGERGEVGTSPFSTFTVNNGITMGGGGEVLVTQRFSLALLYRALQLPALRALEDEPDAADPVLDERNGWVHLLGLAGRFRLPLREEVAALYVHGGGGPAASTLEGERRVGSHLQAALGVEIAAAEDASGFLEVGLALTLPGGVVDRVSGSPDRLIFFSGGFRARVFRF